MEIEKDSAVLSLVELCCDVISSTESYIQFHMDALNNLPTELSLQLLKHIVRSIQSKLREQTIQLKIQLCQQNRLVTNRFGLHDNVRSVTEAIFEKSRNNGKTI